MPELHFTGCSPDERSVFPCNMNAGVVLVCSLSGVGVCLAMVLILRNRLAGYPRGSGEFKKKMEDLSDVIARGARSFLITEVRKMLFIYFIFLELCALYAYNAAFKDKYSNQSILRYCSCFSRIYKHYFRF